MKNRLVIFEGIDGVGKTTLSKALCQVLQSRGIPAIRYEDIEDASGGFNIIKPFIKQHVSVNASFLFYLSSAVHKSEQIEKLLESQWVVCDRYVYSTIAHHVARGIDGALASTWTKFPIRAPDHFFLITVRDDVRLERARNRLNAMEQDRIPKSPGGHVVAMEDQLKSHSPTPIDNSADSIDPALDSILHIILQ